MYSIPQNPNILVIGPAWVGDMVMSQTLFKLLKQQHPDCTIDVLAPAWSNPLLSSMPEVRNTLISPFGHGQLLLKARYNLAKELRKNHYTQVIVLPNSLKSALIPFWTRIPIRTGWRGEWPRNFLLNDTRALSKTALPQMVQRFAALAFPKNAPLPTALPYPKLAVSEKEVQQSLEKQGLHPPTKSLLVLAPGAEFGVSKRWPPRYFAEIADVKSSQGWEVWLLGSPKDIPIAEEIEKYLKHKVVNLIGKTNLSQAIHFLSLADMVVSNDSGLMHIAAALDKPVVAMFGPTPHQFTPPLTDKGIILSLDLPCSPCRKPQCPLKHWRCMLDLKPERVLESLDKLSLENIKVRDKSCQRRIPVEKRGPSMR